MAKYSKGAQKGVKSAMKRMERGTLRSGGSGKKVTNPKQAIAIGLSEAREKGAKVPKKKSASKKAAPKKSAAKKSAVKKSAVKKSAPKKAVKRTAPKKKATASKKSAVKKAAVKKSATAKRTTTTRKPAAKKAATKAVKKAATAKKTAPEKRAPRVKETTQLRSATAEQEMPVAENNVQTEMLKSEDPIRAVDQKAFDRFTSKGDPRQHLRLSSKPKGGPKPSGKKPLWN
ncbi:DUF6496 domain-containing protein [Terrimonas sp. NA20]|uniref:DUF6496 domain-containing protein n=1 Tax=Terrimonas ginsenosidimutans TaxID=2908004 RepID=A0ABS9KZP2_9BACT|nr:DUF6496 domain-containing protein [Terrimonas ginsenosidimutans]MCG2617795.1 DUF6496 domain-containing protein [Terrimonas ginsenosidimutans]